LPSTLSMHLDRCLGTRYASPCMHNLLTPEGLKNVFISFLPFLFALSFHEYAHGWMAKRKGDRTAELMGRLTMNPFAHADLVGTFMLPILSMMTGFIVFGWAKPVPVNERNLRNPRKDMFWVALAGPLSNLLLGAIAAVVMYALRTTASADGMSGTEMTIMQMLKIFIGINMVLAFFNLIPIHPLDGGKVLARFLPEPMNRKLEEAQMISGLILFGLMFTGVLGAILYPAALAAYYLVQFAGGGLV
jgi:Zn-dependent protease